MEYGVFGYLNFQAVETTHPYVTGLFPGCKHYLGGGIKQIKIEIESTYSFPDTGIQSLMVSANWSLTLYQGG